MKCTTTVVILANSELRLTANRIIDKWKSNLTAKGECLTVSYLVLTVHCLLFSMPSSVVFCLNSMLRLAKYKLNEFLLIISPTVSVHPRKETISSWAIGSPALYFHPRPVPPPVKALNKDSNYGHLCWCDFKLTLRLGFLPCCLLCAVALASVLVNWLRQKICKYFCQIYKLICSPVYTAITQIPSARTDMHVHVCLPGKGRMEVERCFGMQLNFIYFYITCKTHTATSTHTHTLTLTNLQ